MMFVKEISLIIFFSLYSLKDLQGKIFYGFRKNYQYQRLSTYFLRTRCPFTGKINKGFIYKIMMFYLAIATCFTKERAVLILIMEEKKKKL
jgi:hypothetical protein